MTQYYGSTFTVPVQRRYGTQDDQIQTSENSGNWAIEFSRYFSNFTKVYGEDEVLSGLGLYNLSYTSSQMNISVSSGRCIQDKTIIYTTSSVDLTHAFSPNLYTYSEDFSNAAWTKSSSSITSNVTATTAPNGKNTADKLVEASSTATNHYVTRSVTVTSGQTYTYSIYVKAAERTQCRIVFSSTYFSSAPSCYINLSTGVKISGVSTPVITSIGDGWYRCSVTATATSSGTASIFSIYTASGGTSSYAGDGTSGIYMWGAQLEVAASPTTYYPKFASTDTFLISTDFSYSLSSDASRPDLSHIESTTYSNQEGFNPFRLRIDYYDGTTVSGWDPTINKIVLGKIVFTSDSSGFTSAVLYTAGTVTIDGIVYNLQAEGLLKLESTYDGGELL